jgi:hypothetical protein
MGYKMGYSFQVTGYYTVKKDGKYPWPCKADTNRLFNLYTDDIFCKMPDGNYSKQTGLGTFGHVLTDDEVIFHPGSHGLHIL